MENKEQIARDMLKKGYDVATVAKQTGLNQEWLEAKKRMLEI